MRRRKQAENALLQKALQRDGEEPAGEAGERILDAAVAHAEDFGLRRFTIDDVARRVGVSRVTVYRYFPKKERLIEAILLRELRRFLADVEKAVVPYNTLEDRLVEGFVFALTALRDHRLLNRVLRTEPELLLPHLTVDGGPVLAAGRDFIARYARAEAGGLQIGDEDIEGVAELLARLVLSFVLTPDSVLRVRSADETRAFAEHYLLPVLQAIRRSP